MQGYIKTLNIIDGILKTASDYGKGFSSSELRAVIVSLEALRATVQKEFDKEMALMAMEMENLR